MSNLSLTRRPETGLIPAAELAEVVEAVAREADAPNTRRVYASQWLQFEGWCRLRGAQALPVAPGVLSAYLTERAVRGARIKSLEVALASIRRQHVEAGLSSPDSPGFRRFWKGLRRKVGAGVEKATPLSPEQLRRLVKACKGKGLQCARDRAMVVLGWAAALRRSELAQLRVEDLEFRGDDLLVTIRSSKTDQEGHGETVGVSRGSDPQTCPVRLLCSWLAESGITSGLIFRPLRHGRFSTKAKEGHALRGEDIALTLKRLALTAGFSKTEIEAISGHSLRRGLGTTAARRGADLVRLQKHMRHKRVDQTVEYVDDAELLNDGNVTRGIGL